MTDKLQIIGQDPVIPNNLFLDTLKATQTCETIEELRKIGFSSSSVKHGSYHHIPAIGAYQSEELNRYFSYNLPPRITDYLDKTNTQDDPGARYAFSQARHIWLSEFLEADMIVDANHVEAVKIVLSLTGDGLVIPLYGPCHRRGYVFVCFGNPKDFYDEIFGFQVMALFQAFHVRYCMIVENFGNSACLTPRESEVLELISFGKTNREIGEILGIKTNTVTSYVKQIFLKLGTQDRVSAALRARSLAPIR